MGWALRITAGGLAVAVAGAAGLLWGGLRMTAPGPLAEPAAVVIQRGSGLEAIAITLDESGVIDSPLIFALSAKLTGGMRNLRAGEYAFAPGVSMDGVLRQLRDGKTVVRRLTVPEGLTSAQIVALLRSEPALTGEPKAVPEDGTLLPETYHYQFGDSRDALLERMRVAMDQALADAWKQRAPDLPISSARDALVLASIVEKETAVPAERSRVAGVFLNRLEQGMKLQSDPTVIYALTDGGGELGRALTRADWRYESPYNTYHASGLPPGPIANPGRASLLAAVKPERHEFLYFVADGTGGHAFAKSLPDHNRNVARWREVQRKVNGGSDAAVD
ncbi:endolytic transglycosylase MltG [Azospirillum sp. RWY-5-1]|uniref:Endolytic murein transglycosylase n=1 Tax=Azospirillum oleiclasticum TaxID=2735135 RepID=A0ABX2T7B4_9PROT|nr:endolytic transglycosylase MltG [Azospirillum oleiclasticum]NYZ11986.1 endolytic transglycosylase MltG [Azospirillum oleiclasticum]NYZ19146.1 endolytic transglycosylase MltG [Azospirillum oleiclasticum]